MAGVGIHSDSGVAANPPGIGRGNRSRQIRRCSARAGARVSGNTSDDGVRSVPGSGRGPRVRQQQSAAAAGPQLTAAPQPGPTPPAAATGQPADDGIAQIPSLISTGLGCLNRGIDGHACAESIITLNGELAYESLAGQIKTVGVPVVIELAKSVPEIAAQVSTFQTPLAMFINQFIEGPQWDFEEPETKGAAPETKGAAA